MKRLTAIDAARGIASVLVMLYHCNSVVQSPIYFADQPFGGFFGSGSVRMPFFFAMSGFMVSWVHGRDLGRPERLRPYLLGRFARIYPTYWVVLGLVLIAYVGKLNASAGPGPVTLGKVIGSILLLPQPGASYLTVAWTLQAMVAFYLVAALGIWRRSVGIAVFACWQAAVGVALALGIHLEFPWSFLLQTLFMDLLLGAVAAQGALQGWVKRQPREWFLAGVAYLLTAHLMEFNGRPLFPGDWSLLTNGIAASVTLMGLATWERTTPLRVPRFLLAWGAASYSIFLIHYPLLSILSKVGMRVGLGRWCGGEVIFVGFALACIGAGILFHRFVEKPLTGWARARLGLARSRTVGGGVGEGHGAEGEARP
ncbi:MAG: acyltransferase family protein [Limisphaerales bacterium]